MAESLSTGQSFGSVSAADGDGLGEVVYSLTETSQVFKIDNSTGELSLVQTLDFETELVLPLSPPFTFLFLLLLTCT